MAETPSQAPVVASGSWGKLILPNAVIVALITAISTSAATRCGGASDVSVQRLEQAQRQSYDSLNTKIDAISASQAAVLARVNTLETKDSLNAVLEEIKAQKAKP
jgi:hypothetical protein